jgi:hypothetical protein
MAPQNKKSEPQKYCVSSFSFSCLTREDLCYFSNFYQDIFIKWQDALS